MTQNISDITKLNKDINEYLCMLSSTSSGGDFCFPDEIMKRVFTIRSDR
jgi:hypothetical protein